MQLVNAHVMMSGAVQAACDGSLNKKFYCHYRFKLKVTSCRIEPDQLV